MIYRTYPVEFLRAIDGDTLELLVDLGFGVKYRAKFRLLNIQAPETGQPGANEAKQFVEAFFKDSTKKYEARSYRGDKYGRWLCEIFDGSVNLESEMLKAGVAKPYFVR